MTFAIEPPGEAGEGLQGGLDHDVCGLGFSNYGNMPTRKIATDSNVAQNNSTTLPVYSYDTEDSTVDAR